MNCSIVPCVVGSLEISLFLAEFRVFFFGIFIVSSNLLSCLWRIALHPAKFDGKFFNEFFQGTARPIRCTLLVDDESRISMDELEGVTNMMYCAAWGQWTYGGGLGAVRYWMVRG